MSQGTGVVIHQLGLLKLPKSPRDRGRTVNTKVHFGRHVNLLSLAAAVSNRDAMILFSRTEGTFLFNAIQRTFATRTKLFTIDGGFALYLLKVGGIMNLSWGLADFVANMTLDFMNLDLGNTTLITSPSKQCRRVFLIVAAFLGLGASGFVGVVILVRILAGASSHEESQLELKAKGMCYIGTVAMVDEVFSVVCQRVYLATSTLRLIMSRRDIWDHNRTSLRSTDVAFQ